MKQFEVGIIGAGAIATNMHIPVLRAMPSVRIAWIADSNAELAHQVARLHKTQGKSVEGLFDTASPDLALLAIPLPPRAIYFDALKKSETAILVEKPLANSLQEHDALVADFADWQIAVGYQRHYYAQFRLAKRIIETDVFGTLRRITVSEGGRTTRTGGGGEYQALPISKGGGIVKNLGCHALDLAFWLAEVSSFSVQDRQLEIDAGADVACRANLTIHRYNSDDCLLDFAVSWLETMDNNLVLWFDKVSIICPVSPAASLEIVSSNGDRIGSIDASGMGATTSAQAFYLEWQDFINAATDRNAQPLSAAATRMVADAMDQILLQGAAQ
jgi:predicted dehydrogenase